MRTPPIEMLSLLEEASNVYPRPRDAQLDKMAETYSKILGYFSMDVLQAALREYMQTSSRGFPRPADLFPLAKSIEACPAHNTKREETMAWYQHGMRGPCPVCGSVLEGGTDTQRAAIHHDAKRHREMDVPYCGAGA